jgi:hypothetical protein
MSDKTNAAALWRTVMANEAAMAKEQTPALEPAVQPLRMPDLKPGKYEDGTPLHEVQYLECKVILKAEGFTSPKGFYDYAKLVRRVAAENDVECTDQGAEARPRIREVIFFDTAKFRLYNNAFILRRRVPYKDGFPVAEAEIVIKFRHPEGQRAAEMDVRPKAVGAYDVKFKAEALPLKDRLGGYRLLFSHNVEFGLSQTPKGASLTQVFPCLRPILGAKDRLVDFVNHTIVEEVLQNLGTLDFGGGVAAKFNVSIWRERGMHRPLVGEFAFQLKFNKREELGPMALDRAQRFFVNLQLGGADWVSLGTTKTGVVYQLRGNLPQAHE